jgi:hypothetical protein
MDVKIDPSSTSVPHIHNFAHYGGRRLGIVAAVGYLGLALYAAWISAWGVALIGIGGAVLMPFLVPGAWWVGNTLRQFTAPDVILTSGMKDTLKQRVFWLVGPQLIASFLVAGVPVVLVSDSLKKAQQASQDRAETRARERETQKALATIKETQARREQKLAEFPKIDKSGESEFRGQVARVCGSLGLPLAACLAEELLETTCESAGFRLDPPLKEIGLVPMRIGLAARKASDEEIAQIILPRFPILAARATVNNTAYVASELPCAAQHTSADLNRQVSAVMRAMVFKAKSISHSKLHDLVWDWMVDANGVSAMVQSVGPYPFTTPSEAFVRSWNGSLAAISAREQQLASEVAAVEAQIRWEQGVVAAFNADQQKLKAPMSQPEPGILIRDPSREEVAALGLSGPSVRVGEFHMPRSVATVVYSVVQPGGALVAKLLDQNASIRATLAVRARSVGSAAWPVEREVAFPLPIGDVSTGTSEIARMAWLVPWGGTCRFLIPARASATLGMPGLDLQKDVVVECSWRELWIPLQPGREQVQREAIMLLRDRISDMFGDRFVPAADPGSQGLPMSAIGLIEAKTENLASVLPDVEAIAKLVEEQKARILDVPPPEAKFPEGVEASVPVKW